jgi:hypothetical protein
VRGLPPGYYFITAVDPPPGGQDDEWQAPEVLDALARDAKSLTLAEAQQLTFNVELRR